MLKSPVFQTRSSSGAPGPALRIPVKPMWLRRIAKPAFKAAWRIGVDMVISPLLRRCLVCREQRLAIPRDLFAVGVHTLHLVGSDAFPVPGNGHLGQPIEPGLI